MYIDLDGKLWIIHSSKIFFGRVLQGISCDIYKHIHDLFDERYINTKNDVLLTATTNLNTTRFD